MLFLNHEATDERRVSWIFDHVHMTESDDLSIKLTYKESTRVEFVGAGNVMGSKATVQFGYGEVSWKRQVGWFSVSDRKLFVTRIHIFKLDSSEATET